MRKRYTFSLIGVIMVAVFALLVSPQPAESEADLALLFTDMPQPVEVSAATMCYEGKEMVDGKMLDKQCMCSGGGTCVCCWWEGWVRILCSKEGACGKDSDHQQCKKMPT